EQYLNYSDVKACFELTLYNETKAIQYDVANLIGELRDGHTWLLSDNYHKYTFYQGLSMYSVIKKDGTQQIKVFNDVKDPSTIDCQVIEIDDRPAIEVITEFARNKTYWSKDLSARFNSALASLTFGNGDFQISGQFFTARTQLPTNPSISYTLKCNDKISKITRKWQVPIKDKSLSISQYKSPYINGTSVGEATLIFDAFIARFYILQNFGVVLISTEETLNNDNDLEYRFLNDLTAGFKLLADKGIKKIILDLSNNSGGLIFVAHYINKLLFPNIQNFPLDLKVNHISIPFIEEFAKLKLYGAVFDYKTYISVKTNTSFDNVMDFIGNNIYTRGGVQVKYTTKAFFNDTTLYTGLLKFPTPPTLPWKEKDIIILTNGICQSSCAIITQRLAEINVPTISVGGFPDNPFSFAQYAVGTATNTIFINQLLENLRLKNLDASLISKLTFPPNLTMGFTIAEAYSINNPDEVMDYTFRPADYQLYYDERSARDPSCLWIQAAKYIEE
ncbi:8346_t:CDS:2, partial [Cetraspora pellucida]